VKSILTIGVLGNSSNIGVKHEVALGNVGRLPLSTCFGYCGTTLIVMHTGVLLVNAFKASVLATHTLCVFGLMIVHLTIDS